MPFENLNTDEYLLAELGERLARQRLDMGVTQADLAFEAGISKRTLERIEAGETVQFTSIIRVLRALRISFRTSMRWSRRPVRALWTF